MKRNIRIGSRESRLAVIQSELVMKAIEQFHPEIETQLITMKTTGDIILDRTLDKIGGKGLFVKELDRALREGRTDLSVHSLKDMPMETADDLPIVGFSKREDPRDVLVYPQGSACRDPKRPIGCSSQRRILQLKEIFPDASFASVRGNVLTRLRKLDEGEYGALVLAAAGLKRLGLKNRIGRYLEPEEMIPAAGQGILAIQGRKGEDYAYLKEICEENASYAALCERSFVRTLNGGCSSPIAAYATVEAGRITLRGLYCDEESGVFCKGEESGECGHAEAIGIRLAEKLREIAQKGRR